MASFDAHANFGYGLVSVAPSPDASGTTLELGGGAAALMPAVPFNATVWPPNVIPLSTNAEIVRVTNIAGSVLTITRAQESSSAMPIVVGWSFANTITKKVITDIEGAINGPITTSGLTMDTGKLLGRTTASTGAIEEIMPSSTNLTLTAGALNTIQDIATTSSPRFYHLSLGSESASTRYGLRINSDDTSVLSGTYPRYGHYQSYSFNAGGTGSSGEGTPAYGIGLRNTVTMAASGGGDYPDLIGHYGTIGQTGAAGSYMAVATNMWLVAATFAVTPDYYYGLRIGGLAANTAAYAIYTDISVSGTGIVYLGDPADASSSTTGALRVAGGVGIAKKLFVGTDITLGGALQLGNAYVATPQVTTGYVTLKDSGGTTYKVLVAT